MEGVGDLKQAERWAFFGQEPSLQKKNRVNLCVRDAAQHYCFHRNVPADSHRAGMGVTGLYFSESEENDSKCGIRELK